MIVIFSARLTWIWRRFAILSSAGPPQVPPSGPDVPLNSDITKERIISNERIIKHTILLDIIYL